MGRTRSNKPDQSLQAAAQVIETRGQGSLLYNSQMLDYILNNQSGDNQAAWSFYYRVPELKYICRYLSNALSMATLYVGEANNEGEIVPLPIDHPASQLMADFAGGFVGQSALLDRLGLHLTIVGDSILIGPLAGTDGAEPPFDRWKVYSTEEVSSRGGSVHINLRGISREIPVPSTCAVVRIWKPDPRYELDADSLVKGSFSVLQELILMDQHIHASAISRLSGAGFLGIPEELDLPTGDMDMEGTEVDRFVALLTEVMGLAIKNRESAAAMVPIILRGPAEYIDKIKHFDFATQFSGQVPELRLAAIRRLALGMDVPPEILTGSAESTSWSAWQIASSTLQFHIVPLLQLITSSLTVGWLHPALERLPLTEDQKGQIPNLVVHYDVSNLKIRQDVTGDAEALFDRFQIDAKALRKSAGYNPDTAPDDKELSKQILLSLVRGNPDLALYAVKALRDNFGLKDLPEPPEAPEAGGPGAPIEAPLPETSEVKGPLPGKRSQDKQVGTPPVPKVGDQSNNEPK